MNHMLLHMARRMIQPLINKFLSRFSWPWQVVGGILFFLGFGVLIRVIRGAGGI